LQGLLVPQQVFLIAPEKGADTRNDLGESITKLGESIKETFVDKMEGLNIAGIIQKLTAEKPKAPDDLEHA